MARSRVWSALSAATRRRYESHGRGTGLTPAEVSARYESGASMAAARGHAVPAGFSERSWRKERVQLIADAAGLQFGIYDGKKTISIGVERVITDARRKGYTAAEIRQLIEARRTSATAYGRGDKAPGQAAWGGRPAGRRAAPVTSLYWYH